MTDKLHDLSKEALLLIVRENMGLFADNHLYWQMMKPHHFFVLLADAQAEDYDNLYELTPMYGITQATYTNIETLQSSPVGKWVDEISERKILHHLEASNEPLDIVLVYPHPNGCFVNRLRGINGDTNSQLIVGALLDVLTDEDYEHWLALDDLADLDVNGAFWGFLE